MRPRRVRVWQLALAVSFALVVQACGGSGVTPSERGMSSERVPDDAETETTIGSAVDHVANAQAILEEVREGGVAALVFATVTSVDTELVRFSIDDSARGVRDHVGAVVATESLYWDDVEAGDRAALIVNDVSREVYSVAVWDPVSNLLREPVTSHQRTSIGHQRVLDRLSEPLTTDLCGFEPAAGPSLSSGDDPRAILEAHVAGTTTAARFREFRTTHEDALKAAQAIADDVQGFSDPLTGGRMPADDRDLYRQILDGRSGVELVPHPTVPLLVDARGIEEATWVALIGGEAVIALFRAIPDPSREAPTVIAAGPVEGQWIAVYTFVDGALRGCISDGQIVERLQQVGARIALIDSESYAGDTRVVLDVASGSWQPVDQEGIDLLMMSDGG